MKYTQKQIAQNFIKKLSSLNQKEEKELVIKAFAQFICEQNKVSKLPQFLKAFSTEWNKMHGEVDVEITEALHQELHFPKELGGKKVNLKIKEDKKLLGGIKIRIGDLVIDNTLQTKIRNLKQTNLTS